MALIENHKFHMIEIQRKLINLSSRPFDYFNLIIAIVNTLNKIFNNTFIEM